MNKLKTNLKDTYKTMSHNHPIAKFILKFIIVAIVAFFAACGIFTVIDQSSLYSDYQNIPGYETATPEEMNDFNIDGFSTSVNSNSVNKGYQVGNAASGNVIDNMSDLNNDNNNNTITGDKMVYRAYLSLQTLEYGKTMDDLDSLLDKYECIVESESESNEDYYWYIDNNNDEKGTLRSNLVVRVPSVVYSRFVEDVSELCQVVSKNANVENISKTYNDKEATIESLEIQKERLIKFMKEANSVTEMLEIEDRLTNVEAELNRYKSELAAMDKDIEYSTVTINVTEVLKIEEETDVRTFWGRLVKTIKDSINNFLEFSENLLFFLIKLIPYVISIGFVVFIIIRRRNYKLKWLESNKSKSDDEDEFIV